MAHDLTDWYEEAERLRVERDALAARLVERDAEVAALREALKPFARFAHVMDDVTPFEHDDTDVMCSINDYYNDTYDAAIRMRDLRHACAALSGAVPAPPTTAPLAAERDAEIAAEKREKLAWMSNAARACAEAAALREACTVAMGYIVRSDWKGTDARKALLALEVGYNPARPTATTERAASPHAGSALRG